MVTSVAIPPMNRSENLAALEIVLDSMGRVREFQCMENLRRAAYMHAIVEAVLSEHVSCLPQTKPIFS